MILFILTRYHLTITESLLTWLLVLGLLLVLLRLAYLVGRQHGAGKSWWRDETVPLRRKD